MGNDDLGDRARRIGNGLSMGIHCRSWVDYRHITVANEVRISSGAGEDTRVIGGDPSHHRRQGFYHFRL